MEKKNFTGLAGLRTFAISMVIACHTGLLAPSSGGIGNKIFFCLSGFLAYFSLRGITSFRDVTAYYFKKIRRIIPAYYIVILFAAIAFPACISVRDLTTENSMILNLFFIKNYGHLWFLQQIMLMYLVSPVLMVLKKLIESFFNYADKKRFSQESHAFFSGLLCALVILLLAWAEKKYFTPEIFRMSGEGAHAQFSIWMFMIGFAFAILYESCGSVQKIRLFFQSDYAGSISCVYAAAFFIVSLVFVIPSVHDAHIGIASFLESEGLRSIAAGLAIFLLAVTADSPWKRLLDHKLFLLISDCSYEMYMIHFFLLASFSGISAKRGFIAVYTVSLCMGYCLHRFLLMRRQNMYGLRQIDAAK